MIITKVLNNNVVISEENHQEVVLMGRGLAFGCKAGDDIRDNLIEKKYVLSENKRELLLELPADIIEMADKIITYAHAKINKKLQDGAFLAMADHMYGVILRTKDQFFMKNFLMWDIKRFFPDEFEVGKYANQLLGDYLGQDLPLDEAGFMALTIVNAELDNGNVAAQDLTQLMEEIMTIVKYSLEISLDDEDIDVQRFITHLKFFCERVLTDTGHQELDDNDMFDLLKIKYPSAYETATKITQYLKQTRNYQTSNDEQMYLTIHLSRMKRNVNEN